MTHKVTDETRKMVEEAAGMGLGQEDIAVLLGIRDPKTLRRRYRRELNTGRAKANLTVARRLYVKCQEGDNTAIIWWEKTRAGKSDRLSLTTPPGEPIEHRHTYGSSELLGEYYKRLNDAAEQVPAAAAADRGADLGEGDPPG